MSATSGQIVADSGRRPLAGALVASCMLALASGVGPAAAQDNTGAVSGVVTSRESGEPLPFSTVTLDPSDQSVFADSGGVFRVGRLAPGIYHVLVRELGYAPADTTVDVPAGPPRGRLQIALTRVPVRLPSVAVRERHDCRAAGLPDSSVSPELASLADALRMNAARIRLLATKYPYEYDVEVTLSGRESRPQGALPDEVDTLSFQSWITRPYRVQHVVDSRFVGTRPRNRYLGPYIYLPELVDLADSGFQAWHCFTFGGATVIDGKPVVRVDFAPAHSLHAPDVAGSVYLDADRMVVRRATFWLTHPERMPWPVRSYRVDVWYREVIPLVAIEDSVYVVQTWGSVVTGGERTSTEVHRALDYRLHVPAGGG